jgi:two-component system chemotaxis response regulator CheB
MLVDAPGRLRLVHGPKENCTRPAVDPLFRSAALAYGPRVIGVVLTGHLDDGAAGLLAVKDRGGIAIVQDPTEAAAPSMPQSAMAQVAVDHCLPVDEIGPLLADLVANDPPPFEAPVPSGGHQLHHLRILETETILSIQGAAMIDVAQWEDLGAPSDLSCPECHGVLHEVRDSRVLRFRCRAGHGFSAKSLLACVAAAREDTMWSAVRATEEEASLARRLAGRTAAAGDARLAAFLSGLAGHADEQTTQLRGMLRSALGSIEPDV